MTVTSLLCRKRSQRSCSARQGSASFRDIGPPVGVHAARRFRKLEVGECHRSRRRSVLSSCRNLTPVPMLKISRVVASGTARLIVSGRIAAEELPQLRDLVRAEHASDLVLDLSEVSLVDVEAVRFLVWCEAQGIRLEECPAYIREWMTREGAPR